MYIPQSQIVTNTGMQVLGGVPDTSIYVYRLSDNTEVYSGILDSLGQSEAISINGLGVEGQYLFINTPNSCPNINACIDTSIQTAQYYVGVNSEPMNIGNTQNMVITTIGFFSYYAFIIITATLAIALAYLIFKFGWSRLINDKSLMIGGFYLRNTPYKGYNRFRSRKWNMKNTM